MTDIALMSGPCVVCGECNYPMSMGGPTICPSCDCGHFGPQHAQRQTKAFNEERAALQSTLADTQAKLAVVVKQLIRANKIIGWMMPYIGNMCPPSNGLFDLNEHCCDNNVPDMGEEAKGPPLKQRAFLATMEKPDDQ